MLIIDGTYLIYKSYYRAMKIREKSVKPIADPHFTKIARNNFLKRVSLIINKTKATDMFIAFDPEGGNFRHELLPSYKSNRAEKTPELLMVKETIYDFLTQHHFCFQIADGYEGDDLIASVIHEYPDSHFEIFSGDKDLAALVSKNVDFLLEKNVAAAYDERVVRITNQNFHKHFDVPASMMADYKSLLGDKSDSIRRVSGIHETEALHILFEYKTIEAYFESGHAHHLFAKMQKHKKSILINKQVASIKRDCPVKQDLSLAISSIDIPRYLCEKINWKNTC